MRILMKGTERFSEGRRDLARGLRIRQIRRTNSRYVPRMGDILVNWGQCSEYYDESVTWLNSPDAVDGATRKDYCFGVWEAHDVPTVKYTNCQSTARRWVVQLGVVMHRSLNSSSQGRGITLCHNMSEVTEKSGGFFCQLFGTEDNKEYRIHVVDGEVIDTTQKRQRRRSNGYTGPTDRIIRSASNGWVFCRENLDCPEAANIAAIKAVKVMGLDFGAVDIAVSPTGQVCVYEVNTAPGLEGTTLSKYIGGIGSAITRRIA